MRMLGVDAEDRDHPHFGRPEDCLRELEKTRWGGLDLLGGGGGVLVLLGGGDASALPAGGGAGRALAPLCVPYV